MSKGSYDHLFKILIIGESGVGKTAIMQRFCENTFEPVYISTVGVDFKPKVIKVNNKTVKMQLWDTAGQDRFRNITASYYRGTQGVLIVYDVSDKTSFDKVRGVRRLTRRSARGSRRSATGRRTTRPSLSWLGTRRTLRSTLRSRTRPSSSLRGSWAVSRRSSALRRTARALMRSSTR